MANEFNIGNKLVLRNGNAMTLGRAASDPGSPVAGDQYYNTVSNVIRFYNGSVWADVSGSAGANTALSNLASVAINTDLISDTDITDSLGTAALRWLNLYVQSIKDSGDVTAIDVEARNFNDVAGNPSVEADARLLRDSVLDVALDFENRQLRSGTTIKLDYSGTDLDVNTRKIINLVNPTGNQDAATKVYVDNVAQGLKPKQAVRAATTVAGTLASSFENGDTIDGVVLATGNRILIKDQAAPAENGIYTVNASGAPTRATDFDSLSPIDEINGAYVAVQEGTDNEGAVFVQQGTVVTIGVSAINFVQFASAIGANVSLSNLSGVAINASLISDTDVTYNLGSAALRWNNIYASLLKDSADVTSMDIENRQLLDSAGDVSVDFNGRVLSDEAGNNKVQFAGDDLTLNQTILKRSGAPTGSGGEIEQQYIPSVTLTANTTVTVTSYVAADFEGAIVDYKIKQASSGAVRTGQMYVSNNGTSTVSSSDNYTETLDAEIILSADINGSDIRIRAQNTDAANNSIMRLDIKRIAT